MLTLFEVKNACSRAKPGNMFKTGPFSFSRTPRTFWYDLVGPHFWAGGRLKPEIKAVLKSVSTLSTRFVKSLFAQQLSQWQAITRGQNQAWEVILSQLLSGEQNFLHTFLLFQQITLMTFSTSSKTYHLFRRESEIQHWTLAYWDFWEREISL